MQTYRVEYEIRQMGAIGSWSSTWFQIIAETPEEALIAVIREAHLSGFEARFPIKIER